MNGKTLLVVWTDESGDDILALEPTIAMCRQNRVQVSIIGPTAVLGSQEGTHTWTHPPTGQLFHLPVMKGPRHGLPRTAPLALLVAAQAARLARIDLGTREDFTAGTAGYNLAAMSSGFPPYALTRLAVQTGGTMTIFDRGLDQRAVPARRPAALLARLSLGRGDHRGAAILPAAADGALVGRCDPLVVASQRAVCELALHAARREMRRDLGQLEFRLREETLLLETALAPFGPKGAKTFIKPSPRPAGGPGTT